MLESLAKSTGHKAGLRPNSARLRGPSVLRSLSRGSRGFRAWLSCPPGTLKWTELGNTDGPHSPQPGARWIRRGKGRKWGVDRLPGQ